jgi:serine/threonine protein kinase
MREQTVFIEALEKEGPAERAAFLDQACAGDPDLRQRIERLLQRHQESASFLDSAQSPSVTDVNEAIEEGPGAVIGAYKLLEQIGEGGFGVVFMAEQTHPVRRKVALKVLKPGMDTRQVVARFEAERQALALMDHPNIAHIFDGGETSSGRPYFVMELVKGIPIADFCDQGRLTLSDRLKLFVDVCQAVQHAHHKGVIHRDLKPSNVLVTLHDGTPVPKVIDFGIAKSAGQQLTDKTLFTNFAQMIGTPLYMSPEQAALSGLDVDTRSDIYSLGVLLYELLTGTTPFDKERFRTETYDEIRRIIREEEPPKPSTRLSTLGAVLPTVSAQRRTESTKLAALVKGDLDWIVMKALEKDRSRRYEAASALAADVRRFLNQEPVEARPPSTWYRFGKLAGRNRVALWTAALVAAVLVLGTAVSTWQAVRAIRAERQARDDRDRAKNAEAQTRAEADKSKAINEFLTTDLLTQAEPANNAAEDHVELVQVLDRAAAKVGQRFEGQPELEAALRATIARTYHGLASWEKAEAQLRSLLDAARKRDPQSAEVYRAQGELAHILGHRGRRDAEVMKLAESAALGLERTLGPEHLDTLNALDLLARAYLDAGKFPEAIAMLERVRDAKIAKLGTDHSETLITLHNLARAYEDAGKLPEAIALFERVRDAEIAKLGPYHPETLTTLNNLAEAYRNAGKLPEAIALVERVRDAQIAKRGPDHPETLATLHNLAEAYRSAGKLPEAIALFERVRDARIAKVGPHHPDTLITLDRLATAYGKAGKLPEAIALLERVHDAKIAKIGPDHPETLNTLNNLALAYLSAKQLDKSVPLFEDVLKRQEAKLGRQHPSTQSMVGNLGISYMDSGRLSEAIPLLEEAYHASGNFAKFLALAYQGAGRLPEAIALFERVRDAEIARLGPDHPDTLTTLNNLAVAYWTAKQLDKSVPLFEDVLKRREAKLGRQHPDTQLTVGNLGVNYGDSGRLSEAIPLLEEAEHASVRFPEQLALAYHGAGRLPEAIALFERVRDAEIARLGPDHPDTLTTLNNLAVAYWSAKQLDKSVPLFEDVLKRREAKLGRQHPDTQATVANLGVNYKDSGRLNEAIPLLEEACHASGKIPDLRWVAAQLLETYAKAGRSAQVVKMVQELVADAHKSSPKDSPQLAGALAQLGPPLIQVKAYADAEPILRECLAIREKRQPGLWSTFNTKSMLGGALLGQKKYAEAEPPLIAGYEGMKQREATIPPQAKDRLPEALERLVQLDVATDKLDRAARWRKELEAARAAQSSIGAKQP